jgi:tRNA-splicing ligase RtcB (3'-phosphate/5'-hydroxy nucleic acid ligase)
MRDTTYNVIKPDNGVPIKTWTKGVPLEDAARQQLLNVAKLPFIYKWVAAMPDVHWGIGATVGSVIPTRGAIIPAAVGVDIGCGMMAVKTSLHANQLPDNLHGIRTAIEKAVPHGRTSLPPPINTGQGAPLYSALKTIRPRAKRIFLVTKNYLGAPCK